jgi:hypothetical protein
MIFKNDRVKILFIHIPKTGGTSIEDSFCKEIGIEHPLWHKADHELIVGGSITHLTAKEINEKYIPVGDFDFVFTIVRNPYERFISLANWLTDGWDKGMWQYDRPDFLKFFSLKELISNIKELKYPKFLWIPQIDYIKGFEDKIKVYRLEDGMEAAIDDINERFNLNLLNINTNYSKKSFSLKDLTDSDTCWISKFYSEDIAAFNY